MIDPPGARLRRHPDPTPAAISGAPCLMQRNVPTRLRSMVARTPSRSASAIGPMGASRRRWRTGCRGARGRTRPRPRLRRPAPPRSRRRPRSGPTPAGEPPGRRRRRPPAPAGHRGGQLLLGAAADGDVGAVAHQAGGGAQPDAAASSGHQRGVARRCPSCCRAVGHWSSSSGRRSRPVRRWSRWRPEWLPFRVPEQHATDDGSGNPTWVPAPRRQDRTTGRRSPDDGGDVR